MNIQGQPHRSIEAQAADRTARIIDQTRLPQQLEWRTLTTLDDAAEAIQVMRVRGAPLTGATAAMGMSLALRDDASDARLQHAYDKLLATRPTAVNLRWALDRMRQFLAPISPADRADAAWQEAVTVCDQDVETNRAWPASAISKSKSANSC